MCIRDRDAAQLVPEDNILILYDRALMDDKAYVSDEEFAQVIAQMCIRDRRKVFHVGLGKSHALL